MKISTFRKDDTMGDSSLNVTKNALDSVKMRVAKVLHVLTNSIYNKSEIRWSKKLDIEDNQLSSDNV